MKGLFDPDSFKTEISENFQLMNYSNPGTMHQENSRPNSPENITDKEALGEDGVKRE